MTAAAAGEEFFMGKHVDVPTDSVHLFRLSSQALDPAAQSAVLVEAARLGVPFCEE